MSGLRTPRRDRSLFWRRMSGSVWPECRAHSSPRSLFSPHPFCSRPQRPGLWPASVTRSGFRAFGRFAGAAAIGLLGVTLLALARPVVELHAALLIPAALVLVAERQGVSPVLLLVIAVALGALASAFV